MGGIMFGGDDSLLTVDKHLNYLVRNLGRIEERVLLLFWYMRPQWALLRKRLRIVEEGGYLWPVYRAEMNEESFSIVQIPAPGAAIMDMMVQELSFLGAKSFLLWGSVASIKENWHYAENWLWAKGAYQGDDYCNEKNKNQNDMDKTAYIEPMYALAQDEFLCQAIFSSLQKPERFISGDLWCIQSPYQFTKKNLYHAIQKGALAVDMESYNFFASLQRTGKKGMAIYYPRDSYSLTGWTYSPIKKMKAQRAMGEMTDEVLQVIEKLSMK